MFGSGASSVKRKFVKCAKRLDAPCARRNFFKPVRVRAEMARERGASSVLNKFLELAGGVDAGGMPFNFGPPQAGSAALAGIVQRPAGVWSSSNARTPLRAGSPAGLP